VQATSAGLLSTLAHGTAGQVLTMSSGTAYGWAAAPTGTTNLTFGSISALTAPLLSSSGTDVTISAGTGVTFSGTSTNLTINAASSGTVGITDYISTANTVSLFLTGTTTDPRIIPHNTLVHNTGQMSSTANGITITESGNYEVLYGYHISCDHPNGSGLRLSTSVYGGQSSAIAAISGSGSTTTDVYIQNEDNYYSGKFILTVPTGGYVLAVKILLSGATSAPHYTLNDGHFSIKKLN